MVAQGRAEVPRTASALLLSLAAGLAGMALVTGTAAAAGARPAHAHTRAHARRHTPHNARRRSHRAGGRGRVAEHMRAARLKRAARRRHQLAILADSPCANATLTPASTNVAQVRAAVVCLIDRERARHGEQPLRVSQRMQAAAQHHCDDMLARDYFEHEGPGGETLAMRLRASGYLYSSGLGYVVGENIAWGTLGDATPSAIVAAWMASPEHRANILDARFRDTGVGVAAAVPPSLGEGQPGAMYTQDFGRLIAG